MKILQISCGGEHAAVRTCWGDVLTWGKGASGRLGMKSFMYDCYMYVCMHIYVYI
jgi:alpha-tubulin suppressor-like RCC1 family protein